MRFRPDHSTFSALNVDSVIAAKQKDLASLKLQVTQGHEEDQHAKEEVGQRDTLKQSLKPQKSGADSEAETSSDISGKDERHDESTFSLAAQGRCVSFGLSSMASATGEEAQALSEVEELAVTPSVTEDALELGDFFKSPKGKTSRGRKANTRSQETAALAPGTTAMDQGAGAVTESVETSSAELPHSGKVVAPSAESEQAAETAAAALPHLAMEEMRNFLLAHRTLAGPVPAEVAGLQASEVLPPEEPFSLGLRSAGRQISAPLAQPQGPPTRQVSAPLDSASFALRRQTSAPVPERFPSSTFDRLSPSSKAYRVRLGDKSPMDELRRKIKCQLNKVCPESVTTIALRISDVEVQSADELQEVISLIFQKALSEPHYCATYADLVFQIKTAFPEFPCPEGGKPQTFKTLLLDVCQKEFESLPTSLEPTCEEVQQFDAEELEFRRKKTKDRLLANMKLIGHLFLRQMLSPRVIGAVIEELTLCHSENADCLPAGHCVECAVELLLSIGHTLEAQPVGKAAVAHVCGRLLDLKQRHGSDGRGVYCKRIQFAIQDLLDVRAAGWVKKVFSGVARTKSEIRMEQQRDLMAQASGKEVASGQVVILGQRPDYIES